MAAGSFHKAVSSDRIVDTNREQDGTSRLLRQIWAPTQCVAGVDLTIIPVPGVGLVAPKQFSKS